ncbi:MAG: dephospho-CoA kinase [Bacillota bacterium]
MNRDPDDPIIIGLTGGLGSGKTAVGDFLRRGRVPVISCDEISHQLMRPGHPMYERTVAEFGDSVLDADGRLDRGKLGERIFSDPDARERLQEITHPGILEEMGCRLRQLATEGARVVILDIPLLYEEGLEDMCDEVWVVWCRREQQVRRVMRRDGLSEDEVNRRIDAQMPLQEKIRRADLVIDNSGTPDALACRLAQIWELWMKDNGFA